MKKCLLLLCLLLPGCGSEPPAVRFEKGDHICIIGGGFADRMQHSGYWETLIQHRFSGHELVFRNLGFAGDEVATRMRSEGFGTPDDWMKKEKADVVLAFFGANESFKGQEGLDGFKKDLEKFIKETLAQNYSGKGAPRLVLFSPTAAEKHSDPNYPNPEPLNRDLKLYADATAEIAKANKIPFVDLFGPSKLAYAQAKESLTVNGVHLRDAGYKALAPTMFRLLLGEAPPSMEGPAFEKLRAAVNTKSEMWFSRYRTMDGYNVYGGRSYLEFDGTKNRDTMQREMEMRDVMTANRERRVWAIAQGDDLKIDDSNLPPPIDVKTNKPGPNPDGSHVFLSGEEAIGRMKLPPGCKVGLFASEKEFPDLVNPVQMAFDTKGRLWVAAWPNYPERTPQSTKGDSLLVFEDTNGDGKADKVTPFVDDLNCPTGFQFYKDGVILVQAPDVLFLRDTDGDGKADTHERIVNGLDSADSHHTANALVLDPGGSLYLSDGVFHRTQMETPWGPPVRNRDAAIYRFEPRTSKVETYISYGFANPHGRVFDFWGSDLVTDATGNNTYFGPAFSGHIDFPNKHEGLRQFWERPSRPCPGTGILSSRHFPEEFQENFLNANVIGFQGIFRVKVRLEGSGLWGDTIEPPLVQSDDPNFRPTAVDVAPDGSVYFLDWHNAIIGHMQHHIRDPNRDHEHGRIYRITYEGRPLLEPAKIAGQPIDKLLDLLKEPENNVRTRAKIELGARDTQEVLAAVKKWSAQFDAAKIEDQHHLLEALWVHQWHNVVNEGLLEQMLKSPEPRARAAAVHVLCYWRDRVPRAAELLKAAANDESPRVRIEAVRAASFLAGSEGMDIAYDTLKHETDYYLDYVFKETTRQLAKTVKGIYLPKDPGALAKLIPKLSEKDLLAADDVEPILMERLERPGVNVNIRTAALTSLANQKKSDPIAQVVAILQRLDAGERSAAAADDLGFLLAAYPAADLAKAREFLSPLAAQGQKVQVRRAAYAGLVAADAKPEAVWSSTATDAAGRSALIGSIALHADRSFRTSFGPLLNTALADAGTPAEVRNAALKALPLMGPETAKDNFALLAANIRGNRDVAVSARAMMQLPRDAWPADQAAPLAEAIVAWARNVPPSDRTGGDFVDTVQAGMELAGLAPADAAGRIRKELHSLGVTVFSVRSVREEMRYDVRRIVVEAGKPFQIVFENVDMMPHNLTVLEPGAREEIGKISDGMPPTPDSQGRSFVPQDTRVIAATKMVEPGMKEVLRLKAPDKVGDYEYVCTYPEHWKVMYGQLVVVKDVEAYLQTAPPLPPLPSAEAVAEVSHPHKP